MEKFLHYAFEKFLSPAVKEKSERLILSIAILSYLVHLAMIGMVNLQWVDLDAKFLRNPIAAIYTPFSFILIYEVYLLIFFLPQSSSVYIGKQYEIITLIIIRRIFKDIAGIELTTDWFQVRGDLQFTFDVLTSLVLFLLIYFFYRLVRKKASVGEGIPADKGRNVRTFIRLKQALAVALVPVLLGLALYTLVEWVVESVSHYQEGILGIGNLNNIFFDEFFTILIIVDVLLLLASFYYSDRFHTIIRNSGFVISTILIKISFSVDGVLNNILIVGAVLFGLLMLMVHNLYEGSHRETGVPRAADG
ncbi:MAG: hypothetical protein RLY31_141 [Bacteroidota bacterium]|jgi:hypothetical protein